MKIAAVLFGSLFCAFAVAEDVPSPALACNPNGIDAAEWPHYEKLLGLLYSAARERRELSDGYTVPAGWQKDFPARDRTVDKPGTPLLSFPDISGRGHRRNGRLLVDTQGSLGGQSFP